MKLYGDQTGSKGHKKKYSPAERTGIKNTTLEGRPNDEDILTSYVERQNLTMRMSMRRFTRLTNAFSKKIENHCWSVALHFMHYNLFRIHQSLRVTTAMEAGVTDRLWNLEDIIKLVDDAAPKPNRPKTCKERNSK